MNCDLCEKSVIGQRAVFLRDPKGDGLIYYHDLCYDKLGASK